MDECVCGCEAPGPTYRRGLVWACYRRERDAGRLQQWPARRPGRPAGFSLEDALILRARHGPAEPRPGRRGSTYGITWRQVAAELGVPFDTLCKARERAGWPDVGRPRVSA